MNGEWLFISRSFREFKMSLSNNLEDLTRKAMQARDSNVISDVPLIMLILQNQIPLLSLMQAQIDVLLFTTRLLRSLKNGSELPNFRELRDLPIFPQYDKRSVSICTYIIVLKEFL